MLDVQPARDLASPRTEPLSSDGMKCESEDDKHHHIDCFRGIFSKLRRKTLFEVRQRSHSGLSTIACQGMTFSTQSVLTFAAAGFRTFDRKAISPTFISGMRGLSVIVV